MNNRYFESNDKWKDKISNPHQLGGIETSVLDNGQAKGVRIAWINAGSGLRYKVVIDRAMDIAEAFYKQYNLSWISRSGITGKYYSEINGNEWLKSFSGFMVTCGLSHIGGYEEDDFGQRGLHGRINNQPAEITEIVQPDPISDQFEMSLSGVIYESTVFGPHLELRRKISSTIGLPKIKIRDVVTNKGNVDAPHMILYHCNFGFPLIDKNTMIFYDGDCISRGSELDNDTFNENSNYKLVPDPIDSHRGNCEAVGFIDIKPDESGLCSCGLFNPRIKIALVLKFLKSELPWLTNWQHWGKGEYVTGLEPGTNVPLGQAWARERGNLIFLKPGEERTYNLEITILDDENEIKAILGKYIDITKTLLQ